MKDNSIHVIFGHVSYQVNEKHKSEKFDTITSNFEWYLG